MFLHLKSILSSLFKLLLILFHLFFSEKYTKTKLNTNFYKWSQRNINKNHNATGIDRRAETTSNSVKQSRPIGIQGVLPDCCRVPTKWNQRKEIPDGRSEIGVGFQAGGTMRRSHHEPFIGILEIVLSGNRL